ncbi:MAG: nitroreductase family protein [Actinomycetota bacterium]
MVAADALYELMSTQRAVRRLRADPVPDDVVDRVLQAACWAPTGGNGQPWRVVAVRAPERKRRLAELYAPMWHAYAERYATKLERIPEGRRRDSARRTLEAGTHLADHLHEVPVVLVFLADLDRMTITDADLDRPSIVGGGSVYPAVQNLLLACRAEGLGCVLTTLHCAHEAEVRDIIEAPPEWAVAGVVPIGWPVGGGHGPITRRPPSEMVFDDTFGTPHA